MKIKEKHPKKYRLSLTTRFRKLARTAPALLFQQEETSALRVTCWCPKPGHLGTLPLLLSHEGLLYSFSPPQKDFWATSNTPWKDLLGTTFENERHRVVVRRRSYFKKKWVRRWSAARSDAGSAARSEPETRQARLNNRNRDFGRQQWLVGGFYLYQPYIS